MPFPFASQLDRCHRWFKTTRLELAALEEAKTPTETSPWFPVLSDREGFESVNGFSSSTSGATLLHHRPEQVKMKGKRQWPIALPLSQDISRSPSSSSSSPVLAGFLPAQPLVFPTTHSTAPPEQPSSAYTLGSGTPYSQGENIKSHKSTPA